MAMSMLSSTIMLMTEYEPNMSSAQKRVKPLIPVRSKVIKSTNPKLAQNRDCDVSNRLKVEAVVCETKLYITETIEFLHK